MLKLNDTQVADLLKSEVIWNRARRVFSANMEHIARQRSLSPLELRRMEFEAVAEIAGVFGVTLSTEPGPAPWPPVPIPEGPPVAAPEASPATSGPGAAGSAS